MRRGALGLLLVAVLAAAASRRPARGLYPNVDTGQEACFDDRRAVEPPAPGQPYHGQDAQYAGRAPSYRDHGDGTVTDLVTGLTWQQDPGGKVTWDEAMAGAAGLRLGGYDGWRVPTIKELYSLIDFRGVTAFTAAESRPYLDTAVFRFRFGDEAAGERMIDAQYCSSTEYRGRTMGGQATVFGVNFADGRIKGYPKQRPGRGAMLFFCRYVRGNPEYGRNDFHDNGDGTITDRATGLMWLRDDSSLLGAAAAGDGRLNWREALAWAEGLVYAGHDDWRLPNVKELQSLVDYARSPDASRSAAIDPLFRCRLVGNEAGDDDYGWYWTSTTHQDGPRPAAQACYVAFGRATGYFQGRWQDVHGAGAQRSDPKAGDARNYPTGRGPQGDGIRILNLVRCVRDAD